jgi:fructokinase
MAASFTIVGLGEALFDIFQDRQILGGAPLNMAAAAHQLSLPLGGQAVVVSRVGQDDLGRQITDQLSQRQMEVGYVQTDPDRSTGKVFVTMGDRGEPDYEIVKHVAWDWIQFDPDAESLASGCDGVCFGSLAQRCSESRSSILRFVGAAKRAVRMFDVNLRQDYYDQRLIRRSCELANVVKLNIGELKVIGRLLDLGADLDPQAQEADVAQVDKAAMTLVDRFDLKLVALTRGKDGTALYTTDQKLEGQPVSYDYAPDADSVGAGDACSAGLMVGLVRRWTLEKTLEVANRAGAFVASQPGATPQLPDSLLELVQS